MITIRATIGDTIEYTVNIKRGDGSPYILTSCSLWFTAKVSPLIDDDSASIKAYWVDQGPFNGIIVTNQLTGSLTIKIPPAVTSLLAPVSYLIDLQVKDPDGDIFTVDSGTLIMKSGITTRTTTP